MAMTILNNTAAALTLGELNKNVSALGKQLKKVATGTKFDSAGEGASEYVISERMRVRKRALEQDASNVQTGQSMLKVAEGAIQEQLEIMKTIKAKVIDANNDTNTDLDRLTIQKEISQGFEQVHDIAYETNYNGKLLLVGDTKVDEIYTWRVLDHPETVPESDGLNLIEDQYATLDNETGPFAVLSAYSTEQVTAEVLLGSAEVVNLSGGAEGTPEKPTTFTLDFSGYTNANAEGLGFWVAGTNNVNSSVKYVLTNNPSGNNYRYGNVNSDNVVNVNISGCDTSAKIAAAVATAIKTNSSGVVGSASVEGNTVKASTRTGGYLSNYGKNVTVKGWSQGAGSAPVTIGATQKQYGRDAAAATGLGNKTAYGSAGSQGTWVDDSWDEYDPVTDTTTHHSAGHWEGQTPATAASLQLDISSVASGSGFALQGPYGTAYVRFVEGSSITHDTSTKGVYEIGKNASGTVTLGTWSTTNPNNTSTSGIKLSISGGQLTLTTTTTGSSASIRLTDGFSSEAGAEASSGTTQTVNFLAVTAYDDNKFQVTEEGKAKTTGPSATYDIDLTDYDTTDSDKLEEFIENLKGKAIKHKYKNLDDYTYSNIEFIDKKVPSSIDAQAQLDGSTTVDLNILRSTVGGSTTIADAFINLMKNNYRYSDVSAETGTKTLRVTARNAELAGNNETLSIIKGNMSSYTIDFNSYFASSGLSIPDDLDGKGFRLYCATCADQWFNFQFKSKLDPSDADRPASGQSGADLKTTLIDIANVTDVKSLVQALYDQGSDALEHIMNGQPHTLHFAADPDAGTLTVYDKRMYDLRASGKHPYVQEMGAKLADGVLDDVQKATRGIFVRDLVIHHTDKASMNIHLQIPQTSMDHLFNYIPGLSDWTDYNVLTRENREKLLGNQGGKMSATGIRMVNEDEQGLLDRAIQYLTDANTLVGAQLSRLGTTHDNIITQQESTTSSESTIRDADMAKEMTEYTKSNVLAQAAQSMLAQANQNNSAVLSLLQ